MPKGVRGSNVVIYEVIVIVIVKTASGGAKNNIPGKNEKEKQ
jgi:hypothetical protein